MKNIKKNISLLVLCFVLSAVAPGILFSQNTRGILLVPQNYSSIQSGINAAGIGDTVLVAVGVYNENINFNGKTIMVASQYLLSGDSSHIIQTVIDGNNNGPVVTFNTMENENSLLVGFTLRDGLSTFGGGVYCESADPVLSNLIIKNCDADYGAGIYLYESNAYIWRVAFTGNQATLYGGAISCDTYSYPAIYNTRIFNNSAQYGGGIHCYLSDPYISDFEIRDNNADYGGGIYLYQSSPYIWDGIVSGNSAVNYGGGIECDYYSQAILSYISITNNNSVYGAGLHVSFSDVLLDKLTLAQNTADYGGGIYCYYSYPAIKNSIVAFNHGEYGIYAYESSPLIEYSNFWENEEGNFYNTAPEIGLNSQVNINNDSCDVFFNMQKNPNFVDLNNSNFQLLSSSRCIDAGNPESPEDEDGSTVDMGRYSYYQSFVANFSAETTYGLPPLTVQFTDESTGNPQTYAWDFNDDGIIDSYEENPEWVYDEMGDYTVILSTSRGFLNDKRLKPDFIKVYYISQPSITQIVDVPNDQGGWVTVRFLRSVYDTDTLAVRSTERYTVQYNIGDEWISANSAAAYGEDEYTILCHTPFDSTASANGLIDFRIIASMDEGNFASSVVQGYSVDNLSPQVPDNLLIEIVEEYYRLSWQAVSDPDLQYYALYISDVDGNFSMDPDYVTIENHLDNIPIGENEELVALRAIDFAGNESGLSEAMDVPMMMTVDLQSGWNSLSGFVAPAESSVETMFAGMANELVFLSNADGFWYPTANQNTLVDWDSHAGYQIKLSNAVSFSIVGYAEKDKTVQLYAGWNLIPVLSACPVSIAELETQLEDKLRVIKEAVGYNVNWPGQGIETLQELQSGKSYLIYLYDDASLIFPECD